MNEPSIRTKVNLLFLVLSIALLAVLAGAQQTSIPLVNNTYLQGQRRALAGGQTPQPVNLIGVDSTNVINIDPTGNSVTIGTTTSTVQIPGATYVTTLVATGVVALTAGEIGASELATHLQIGYIPIGIFNTRLLTTNAFLNTIEAGTPDGNTTPSLQRVNAATDKATRLIWAASDSSELHFPSFSYPPDLDDTKTITINFLAAMGGATDIPVLTVSFWEGLGDTNAGGNTGAVTGITIAKYSFTVAAADVGAYPNVANFGITPAAHTTDALHIYGVWVEYTRRD